MSRGGGGGCRSGGEGGVHGASLLSIGVAGSDRGGRFGGSARAGGVGRGGGGSGPALCRAGPSPASPRGAAGVGSASNVGLGGAAGDLTPEPGEFGAQLGELGVVAGLGVGEALFAVGAFAVDIVGELFAQRGQAALRGGARGPVLRGLFADIVQLVGQPGAVGLGPVEVAVSGLVAHSDAGSQYRSIAYTERLAAAGAAPSVGSVGDAYDNALAESTIGLFKTELIKPRGPWRTVEQVEIATLEYVDWFNHRRLHSAAADLPPAELEAAHYRQHIGQPESEHSTR